MPDTAFCSPPFVRTRYFVPCPSEVAMVICPKCQTTMEMGFLLDRGESNTRLTQEWVEGQPEKSFWTGLKLKGRRRIPVAAVRCRRCGYVELYANFPG